jgi:hypothetical protein
VVNVLGGSTLDLSAAELAADRVELKIVCGLGGAEITVPPGLNVEVSQIAILGGNGIDVGDERPDPGGPVVRVRLVSILGGAEVRRGPKLTPPAAQGAQTPWARVRARSLTSRARLPKWREVAATEPD